MVDTRTANLPAQYLGLVASSGLLPDNRNTGAFELMSRTVHKLQDTVVGFQLVYANLVMAGAPAVETNVGACNIQADVKFADTGYLPVTFNGATTGTDAGGGLVTS